MESELALVALGEEEKSGRIGVPRLATTDAEWREIVELLFRHCSGIVLLPGYTRGVLEETVTILRRPELRTKTVCIMPPKACGINGELLWEQARRALEPRGVKIPHYFWRGGLLQVDGWFIPWTYQIKDRNQMRNAIMCLIAEDAKPPAAAHAMVDSPDKRAREIQDDIAKMRMQRGDPIAVTDVPKARGEHDGTRACAPSVNGSETLDQDEFRCFRCQSIISENAESCAKCGRTWG